ncbi:QcrA and Rieske domain-containing protein [Ciceribacter selenitireducens]
MSEGFVKVGRVSDFNPNGAPVDITAAVHAAAPSAEPRMLTRLGDGGDGSAVFVSVSSTCTHQGCPILTGDGIWGATDAPIYDAATRAVTCPCHNSKFDVSTGVVIRGPANKPLLTFATEVSDDEVFVAIAQEATVSPQPAVAFAGSRQAVSGVFPGTGNRYLVEFGAFTVELYFRDPYTLTYTGVRRDGSRGASETVAIETTYLKDFLFLVTWKEADGTTVVHVEDFDQFIIHTNITGPDMSFTKYRGTFKLRR